MLALTVVFFIKESSSSAGEGGAVGLESCCMGRRAPAEVPNPSGALAAHAAAV